MNIYSNEKVEMISAIKVNNHCFKGIILTGTLKVLCIVSVQGLFAKNLTIE